MVALFFYSTGTSERPDGSAAMQLFYAGYLIELTLSLDNLFAVTSIHSHRPSNSDSSSSQQFYLIFKYFKIREQGQMHRVLFWGVLGAIILRALVVVTGVALIGQSNCVLFLAAIVLLW